MATMEDLSRKLSYVLRHSNVPTMLKDGYVPISDVLNIKGLEKYCHGDIAKVVQGDEKQRFSISSDAAGKTWIRANQGHSNTAAISPEAIFQRIREPSELPLCCVHGTSFNSWEAIKISGSLSRMNRTHVHFSTGLPRDDAVISGMRKSAKVLMHLNAKRCLDEGIKLYRSQNDVILCDGVNGEIDLRFFCKVEDVNGNNLLKSS